jgi:hypothetical protein
MLDCGAPCQLTYRSPKMTEKTHLIDSPEKAREFQRRSTEARKRNAQQREEDCKQDALTIRQRIAVAIQRRYTVAELLRLLEDLKKEKPSVQVKALVELMNQSFGRPLEAEPDIATDPSLVTLTREQRAVVREALASMEDEDGDAPA